jgi:hypothetical protein
MADAKAWTVLVWMAGDNDLEDYATSDLGELKRVGTSERVDVVVQLDSMRDDHTRRYHVRAGTPVEEDVVADLGETNTGDPRVAIDFFTWGIKKYPAQRYLLVMWNHGSGIDEEDVYRRARARGLAVARRGPANAHAVPRSRVRAVASRRYRRALFSSTIEAAVGRRAIAYDDTARDFLDNLELEKVLDEVRRRTGRRVDVLGFDACLMNMVEIAYQLRSDVDYIVGSQELEPGDGWPYDTVLKALTAQPAMTPRQLGELIVRQYVASYTGDDVTQSLLDVGRVAAAAEAVDGLARALVKAVAHPVEFKAAAQALARAQRYDTKDFLDLGDLCARLRAATRSAPVKAAADAVTRVLAGTSGLVVAEKHKGTSVARSHGVSIYFPRGDATVAYDRLDFAKKTRWDAFIDAMTGGGR